jgi:2-desacetyl-2-hydroxyethyl bacteriochlorophyllide A dehydrogenase
MKAAVLEAPGQLVLREIPMRTCLEDEVMVKVNACGICGSDLRYYQGENPWAEHTLGRHVENPPNMILGHEISGQVVMAGRSENNHLIGKRVFIEPYNTCGSCLYCRSGRYHLCKQTRHIGHGAGWPDMDYFPGGMADYCQVWATHAYVLPDQISDEEATLLDPLAVAIHAVQLAGIEPGCDVLVLGSGPVGLCIAQAARAFGAGRVFCSDRFERAIEIAAQLGIDYPVNITETNLEALLRQKTDGDGASAIFDTVGTAETQRQALDLLADSGCLVNLVSGQAKLDLSLNDLSGERKIIGSANNLYSDLVLAIKLLAAGTIKVQPLITHRFSLSDIQQGFDLLLDRSRNQALKVVIRP